MRGFGRERAACDTTGVNATDLFHQTLRERIAPALRDAGFTGAGLEYRLSAAEPDHALLGFQRSASSGAEECRFTVNLRAVPYEEHEALRRLRPALGTRLSANRVGPVGWHARIGRLMGHPHDHWWSITDARTAARVADEVTATVLRHAVPALWGELTGRPALPGPVVDPLPDCLDPSCMRVDGSAFPVGGGAAESGEPEPVDLRAIEGTLVLEIGERRRASPFLTLHDELTDAEARIVIDAPWRLEQPLFGSVRVGIAPDGDVRVSAAPGSMLPGHPLALIGELALCRVNTAELTADGSLRLTFERGTPREACLTVSGTPHALTVGAPWQLEGWTPARI